MTRTAIAVLFCVIASGVAFAQGANGSDGSEWAKPPATGATKTKDAKWRSTEGYRGALWGMTSADVKKATPGLKTDPKDGSLFMTGKTSGFETMTGFLFTGPRLTKAVVLFTESHTNPNLYIDDFSKLKDLLTKKYGAPEDDRVNWSTDMFKDDAEHWGTALLMGHVTFACRWKTPETTISLVTNGDNYKAQTVILYQSNALAADAESEQERSELDDL